jgi:hypothetical protein
LPGGLRGYLDQERQRRGEREVSQTFRR